MPSSTKRDYIPTIPVRFPAIDDVQEQDSIADPFDVGVSERVFDGLYGGNTILQAEVAATKTIVSYVDTIQIHRRSSCLRGTVFHDSVPVKQIGECYDDDLIVTDSDGDGCGYRRTVGLLVSWRRYYGLNMFINALLVVSLLDMTGILHT